MNAVANPVLIRIDGAATAAQCLPIHHPYTWLLMEDHARGIAGDAELPNLLRALARGSATFFGKIATACAWAWPGYAANLEDDDEPAEAPRLANGHEAAATA